jgi:uncharacterized membrane protein YagU involved in acid resistance
MATGMNAAAADRNRSVSAGIVAGLIGGIAGTIAMNEAQALWSWMMNGFQSTSAAGRHDSRDWQEKNEDQNANEVMAQTIATHTIDRRLTRDELKVAAPIVHFAFGGSLGAVYGAAMETAPQGSPIIAGAAFGTAVWIGADEIAMPALGLSSNDEEYPIEAHMQSFVAHLAYGITAELVRRGVRLLLAREPSYQ